MSEATATFAARVLVLAGLAVVLARTLSRAGGRRVRSRTRWQLASPFEIGAVALVFWHPVTVATPGWYDVLGRPVGLAAMLLSGPLVVWAYRRMGPYWDAAISVREDHRVVAEGPFAFVRHPVYLGLILFVVGGALLLADPAVGLAAAGLGPLLVLRARAEERFLEERLGDEYRDYARRVPMLLPRIRR